MRRLAPTRSLTHIRRGASRLLPHAAALLSASVLGCAEDYVVERSESQPELLAQSTPLLARAPDGGAFVPSAEITGRGNGCPAGSYSTHVSPDGATIHVTFGALDVELDPSRLSDTADCQLRVRLQSDRPFGYAVTSFAHQGYAFLGPGVRGQHVSRYYYAGMPLRPEAADSHLVGPLDEPYRLAQEVPSSERVFSACGFERTLEISTRVFVRRRGEGAGYMNLSSVGTDPARLSIGFVFRPCNEPARDGGPPIGAADGSVSSLDGGAS